MNQFFYKRITYGPKKEGEEKPEEFVWTDSFNLDKVIRSMEFKGEVVVLLDDGHDMTEEVPVKNKMGKVEYQRQKIWAQSEIHLKDPEDIKRFREVSEIRTNPTPEF